MIAATAASTAAAAGSSLQHRAATAAAVAAELQPVPSRLSEVQAIYHFYKFMESLFFFISGVFM